MSLSRALSSLTLLLATVGAAHATNLVTNPTFGPGISYPGYASSSAPVPGWVGTGNYGAVPFNPSDFWDNGSTGGTTTVGFLQAAADAGVPSSSLSQTLTGLVVGESYNFSFIENGRANYGGTATLSVLLDNAVLIGPSAVTAVGGSNPFTMQSVNFVATNSSQTLEFLATAPSDSAVVFTDVNVSATPEPSSFVMLGTGIMGVAGAMRRRFRKA